MSSACCRAIPSLRSAHRVLHHHSLQHEHSRASPNGKECHQVVNQNSSIMSSRVIIIWLALCIRLVRVFISWLPTIGVAEGSEKESLHEGREQQQYVRVSHRDTDLHAHICEWGTSKTMLIVYLFDCFCLVHLHKFCVVYVYIWGWLCIVNVERAQLFDLQVCCCGCTLISPMGKCDYHKWKGHWYFYWTNA